MKIVTLLLTSLLLASCASQPDNPVRGGLSPCPVFPGCAMTTWTPGGSQEDAWTAIVEYLDSESSMTIIEQTDQYLKVEARTPTMGFVDDVQFLRRDDGTIAARSSSRMGISDLGANKARLDLIAGAIPQLKQSLK